MALVYKIMVRLLADCQRADVRNIMTMMAIDIAVPSPVCGGPNHDLKGNCAKQVTITCHTTHASRHSSKGDREGGGISQRLTVPIRSQSALKAVVIKITSTVGSVCTQMPVWKGGIQAINTFNRHSNSTRPTRLKTSVWWAKVNISKNRYSD